MSQTISFKNALDAIRYNMEPYFSQLYQNKIDINMIDDSGMTVLHHLAASKMIPKDLHKVYELLRHRANANVTNNVGRTPLHYAVLNSRFRMVETFIHFKADLSIKDQYGDTPLHSAAKSNDLAVLAILLMASYDQNPEILEIKNNAKKTFNQLFKSTIQVQIYNRFQSLKGIKVFRNEFRQIDWIMNEYEIKVGDDLFLALVILNDLKTMSKWKEESESTIILQTFESPLHYISDSMRKLINLPILPSPESDSYAFFSYYTDGRLKTLKDIYSLVPSYYNLKNGFNRFNYLCSLHDSKEVENIIKSYGVRTLYPDNHFSDSDLNCSNIESLNFFHPELALKYLSATTFTLKNLDDLKENCPICRNINNNIGDKWIKLNCSHQFHEDCLNEWLPFQKTCPMCRREINIPIKINIKH